MKGFFKLVVFVCLLSVQGGTLWAQSGLLSQVVRHDDIKGKEVITKALSGGASLTCIKSDDSSGNQTFIYYMPSNGSTLYFTCNLGSLFSSSLDDYSIKDMCMVGNKIYFCGSHRYGGDKPVYDVFGNKVANKDVVSGIFGFFYMDEVEKKEGTICLTFVPYTDSLMRFISASEKYGRLVIAGYSMQTDYPTCVVEITDFGEYKSGHLLSQKMENPYCDVFDRYLTTMILSESDLLVNDDMDMMQQLPTSEEYCDWRVMVENNVVIAQKAKVQNVAEVSTINIGQ